MQHFWVLFLKFHAIFFASGVNPVGILYSKFMKQTLSFNCSKCYFVLDESEVKQLQLNYTEILL